MTMGDLNAETIYGCFEETAQRVPERVALIYLDERIRYARLKDMVLRLAASLLRLGIREGDRVVLYLFNMPQTLIAWLALERLGAIVVPVAPVYSSQDLRYLVNDAGAETIFCMDSNFNYVNEILGKTPLQRVIVTNMLDFVSSWKRLWPRGLTGYPGELFLQESMFLFSRHC